MTTRENWFENVVLVTGRDVKSDMGFSIGHVFKGIARTVQKRTSQISAKLHSIPVVGPPLDFSFRFSTNAELISAAAKIAQGKNVKASLYDALKERVKITKEVAPFAMAAVGAPVGNGAEGVIANGNALSKGPVIGDATVQAVANDLPVEGRKIFQDTIVSFTTGKEADNPIVQKAVNLSKAVLAGKQNGNDFDGIIASLSDAAKKGVQVGISLGVAKKIQGSERSGIKDSQDNYYKDGMIEKEKNPIVKLVAQELHYKPDVYKGYIKTLGFLKYKGNPASVTAMREALPNNEKLGFDVAASLKIGMLGKPQSNESTPRKRVGFYLAQGSKGMPTAKRKQVIASVTSPEITVGIRAGLKDEKPSIWKRIINFVLGKDAIQQAT